MNRIPRFLAYLENEVRASGHTSAAYGRDLRQFVVWLQSRTDGDVTGNGPEIDLALVTLNDIRAWMGCLADDGCSATTLRRKAQSLRAFYNWGMKRDGLQRNPAADLMLAKKVKKLPDFIKVSEIEKTLDESPDEFRVARTHIVLTLLYSLGLRQDELRQLTDSDIMADRAQLRVTGKRNKQRILPLPEPLIEEIREWQRIRDARYPDSDTPRALIAGPHGFISKKLLYTIVNEGLADVSANRKSPHTLRHTFATAMINHGADLDAVREMLGHTSLQTTQIYTHVSIRDLLANYRHAHPRMTQQPTASDPTPKDH